MLQLIFELRVRERMDLWNWKIEEMNISVAHMITALKKFPSYESWNHIMIHLLPYRGNKTRAQVEECLLSSPSFKRKEEIISWLEHIKKEDPRP